MVVMIDKRETYAIVIGAGQYFHRKSPEVYWPIDNAGRFAEWLRSPEGGELPTQNIQLLLSPTIFQVERALNLFGINDTSRMGGRLYIYFSGFGIGSSLDDLGFLFSDVNPKDVPKSVMLNRFRGWINNSKGFDEYIWVIDYSMIDSPSLRKSEEKLKSVQRDVRELFLVNGNDPKGAEPGLYTKIVIKAFSGKLKSLQGDTTVSKLEQFIYKEYGKKFEGKRKLHTFPIVAAMFEDMVITENPDEVDKGILSIELPKWVNTIQVFDNQLNEIPLEGLIKEHPEKSDTNLLTIDLLPGIYTISVQFGDRSEQKVVSIFKEFPSNIEISQWKKLSFRSIAPLLGGENVLNAHTKNAVAYSKEITWADSPSGSSRLFLFVRSNSESKEKTFADGLTLFSEKGDQITDFSSGVERDNRWGWLAFCANLKPGNYTLRIGRKGVPVRNQSIFLSKGWETHCFLVADDKFPALKDLSLGMVKKGTGFHEDWEENLITEALFNDFLSGQAFFDSPIMDRVQYLFNRDSRLSNLWMGINAAYAFNKYDFGNKEKYGKLIQEILDFLVQNIPDHPDVRALTLKENRRAEKPFWYPPALSDGIKLVEIHAIFHDDTIPVGSLTDLVLDSMIPDSPWTAWKDIPIDPRYGENDVDWREEEYRDWLAQNKKSLPVSDIPQIILEGSLADPVINIQAIVQSEASISEINPTAADDQTASTSPIQDTYIAQQAAKVINVLNTDELPDSISIDVSKEISREIKQVKPKDISQETGIHLSRVQDELKQLKKSGKLADLIKSEEGGMDSRVSGSEKAVLDAVIQQVESSVVKETLDDADVSWEEEAAVESPTEKSRVTIEDLYARINMEAERIAIKGKEKDNDPGAQLLAQRLRKLAKQLLDSCDFIVLTNKDGKITYSNGAFFNLLSEITSPSTEEGIDYFQENISWWEEKLKEAEVGQSTLAGQADDSSRNQWDLQRTIFEQGEDQTPVAYMNVLRMQNAPSLRREQVDKLSGFLSDLTYASSLYAYGSDESEGESKSGLKEIIAEMASILES